MLKIDKKKCTGCTACFSACDLGCITMEQDEEGFFYPKVSTQNCVNCGKCEKVCPLNNSITQDEEIVTSYVGFSNDEHVLKSCSSGGVAFLLSKKIIANSGIVYGACYNADFHVYHSRIDNLKDLDKVKGSKYLQSDLNTVMKSVKNDLITGATVLFTGTHCQIYGLKRFLGKEYDNLYCLDVLCHGVPSPLLMDAYVKYYAKKLKSPIVSISFRDKSNGWRKGGIYIEAQNGKRLILERDKDYFMQFFMSDICLRQSCYSCSFKHLHRISDITVGDAWGQHENDSPYHYFGNSIVIIHSGKGSELFHMIEDEITFRRVNIDTVLPAKSKSRRPMTQCFDRALFFKNIKSKSIKKNLKLISPPLSEIIKRKVNRLISQKRK